MTAPGLHETRRDGVLWWTLDQPQRRNAVGPDALRWIAQRCATLNGEVVVLTSPLTASAAEAFLLAITEVTDATVVGGRSFGEFSDAIDWTLPDGTELTLSMETYTTLDGENYEAVGVPVDVPASLTSTVDVALETLAGS